MRTWDGRATFGTLPALAARRWGDREALAFRDRRFGFRELAEAIDRTAKGLIAIGVAPGERVCVWLNNCPEWILLQFALGKIGAIQVPINTRFRSADTEYVLRQADCATLVTHDVSGPIDYLAMIRELVPDAERDEIGNVASSRFPALRRIVVKAEPSPPGCRGWADLLAAGEAISDGELADRAAAVRPEDTLFIMYTSGTTGFPKGVMRNHVFLRNTCDRFEILRADERDVMLNYLPLFHIFGFVDGPMLSFMTGARQVLAERFDPDECLELIESEGVTMCCGFETHLKGLVDAQLARPRDVSTLRTGVFAAGMQSAVPIVRRAETVLAPLVSLTAYGMTEIGANGSLAFLDSTLEQRAETSGFPCPGFEYRIASEDGTTLAPRLPGEIQVKSYNLMQGYYGKAEETAAAFTADGWFRTGDMGYLREDGYLRFLGRYKDMLKVGGENVDPMEVEGYLLGHPDVAEVAVVGYPDPRLTEVAVAFVVPRDGAAPSEASIIEFCRGKFASFKIPRHVLLVETLPMTSTGKVRKVELREEARHHLGG